MKITRIRFQNLNSLSGTWCIDFTDPAYQENALFAITGPTGAGKSTLLDAVCLALYGRTPRLAKITKSTNELMSRHTGVCFAEVEFTTMQGSFRCHWSQHRSRKKAGAELQQPKHEIADSCTGKILENRIRKVLNKVEDVTGMDFDRFTRSTLLAQGGFAAFLMAMPDERAPLLEQITGSKIYSQISIQVHEIHNVEKKVCTQMEEELCQISILPEEKETELGHILQKADTENKRLKTVIANLRAQQLWLNNITTLQAEIQTHSMQMTTLEKEAGEKQHALEKLTPALKAKELEPFFRELLNTQNSLQTNHKTLQTLDKALKRLSPSRESISRQKDKAKLCLQRAEELRKAGLEHIKIIQGLDHSIHAEANVLQGQKKDLAGDEKKIATEEANVRKLVKMIQHAEKSKYSLEKFFSERSGDEKLIAEYSLVEGKIEELLGLQELHRKSFRDTNDKLTNSTLKNNNISRITNKLTSSNTKVADVQKELEYLQSKLQLLIRIQSLEDERKVLISSQPCPLCGSTEHPYRAKKLVEISKEEQLDQLIEIQEMLHKRASEWKKNKEEEKHLSQELIRLQSDRKHAEKQQLLLGASIQKKKEILTLQNKQYTVLQAKRQNLFGDKDTSEESKALEQSVKNAQNGFEKLQQECLHIEKEITATRARQSQLLDEQKRQELELDTKTRHFNQGLHKSPFASIDEFHAAKMTHQEIEALQTLSNRLQKQKTELNSLLQDKKKRLVDLELNKKLSSKDQQTLHKDMQNLERELEKQQELAINTKKQLKQNRTEKRKVQQKLAKIAKQKNILSRWSRLHMLIGSADGKKFRNFAQGLTFELMVHQANVHLTKMNNRYILIRDTEQPLELNVIDTYQAGEIRSTKNLSGGESFLISLALALGLSRMASHKIRVDSLFLDEGFGTLDEEALESALDTLSGLEEDNKIIGVISHVAALKERIPLQIEIITKPGGKSIMKGPGISREI